MEGVVLKNLGGFRFRDVTHEVGLGGESVDCRSVIWLDLENRGKPDLFLCNHLGANVLWMNRGGRLVPREIAQGIGGFSMGATTGDPTGDGLPDV